MERQRGEKHDRIGKYRVQGTSRKWASKWRHSASDCLGPFVMDTKSKPWNVDQHNRDSVKNAGQKAHGCHNRVQDMTEFNFAQ